MTWGLYNKQGDYWIGFGLLKQDWKRLILQLVSKKTALFVNILYESQEKEKDLSRQIGRKKEMDKLIRTNIKSLSCKYSMSALFAGLW